MVYNILKQRNKKHRQGKKEAGAVAYEGVIPDVAAFDEIIEKCIS